MEREKKEAEVSVKLEDLIKIHRVLSEIRYPNVSFDEDMEVMKTEVIRRAKSGAITALEILEVYYDGD